MKKFTRANITQKYPPFRFCVESIRTIKQTNRKRSVPHNINCIDHISLEKDLFQRSTSVQKDKTIQPLVRHTSEKVFLPVRRKNDTSPDHPLYSEKERIKSITISTISNNRQSCNKTLDYSQDKSELKSTTSSTHNNTSYCWYNAKKPVVGLNMSYRNDEMSREKEREKAREANRKKVVEMLEANNKEVKAKKYGNSQNATNNLRSHEKPKEAKKTTQNDEIPKQIKEQKRIKEKDIQDTKKKEMETMKKYMELYQKMDYEKKQKQIDAMTQLKQAYTQQINDKQVLHQSQLKEKQHEKTIIDEYARLNNQSEQSVVQTNKV